MPVEPLFFVVYDKLTAAKRLWNRIDRRTRYIESEELATW